MNEEIKHYLRFGTHPENKYFLGENKEYYDSIIFNGNMVAYTQSAIAAFIINLNDKDFIIDPQTHAFQHDPSYLVGTSSKGEKKIKRSIEQLANHLGNPIKSHLSSRTPIVPSSFVDDDSYSSLAKGTIEFQKGIIDTIKGHKDWEYLKYKLDATGGEEPKPKGLIAPYFYMTEFTVDKWIDINIRLIDESETFTEDTELMAQLVISKDILTSEKLQTIIEAYSQTPATSILVWIDSFNEMEASLKELVGAKTLFEALTKNGKKVTNLYGGYYSIILARLGKLEGISNGLEYGESRAVVPVGGGIPMAKYYFYPLHFRMRFADLVTIYTSKDWVNNPAEFGKEVCDCELCIDGDIEKFGITKPVRTRRGANIITLNYPTQDTKDCSLRHYLFSKRKEFQFVTKSDYDTIVSQLRKAQGDYENILGLEAVAHIDRWIEAIK